MNPLMRRRFLILMGGSDRKPPVYLGGEIGDVDTITIEVAFNETVQAADFTAGVTVEVNAAPVVIVSGTLQPDGRTVYYVIPAADVNDVITWAYAAVGGNITDAKGNALADVAAQTVTNYIGSQFYFQDFNCSGHLASLGV